ncbi:MAG: hypothetical protein A3E81_04445 [Gammaproteobacteria bacterium RIFCSPHIGHO2_12_FULL_36_30]|nr:MAG: hypothetical protein A3E81_04445 [Gammaproteobacteria bacterium RIFCSPHIGHO2_12_FULL_36_30]
MVLITLLIMLILVLAGHIILPLLGITLAITTGIWSFAIATVVLLCIATLLFFIFTGIGIFLFGIFAVAWAIGVMIVFPLLFPIIIPVLLVMLIIGFIARRR